MPTSVKCCPNTRLTCFDGSAARVALALRCGKSTVAPNARTCATYSINPSEINSVGSGTRRLEFSFFAYLSALDVAMFITNTPESVSTSIASALRVTISSSRAPVYNAINGAQKSSGALLLSR